MNNVSNKFYLYLLNKNKEFFKKEEIKHIFKEFSELWNLDSNFSSVFQTLKQQQKIVFIFNKIWKILDKNTFFKYKNGDITKLDFIINYLDESSINWYFGLSTANYFLGSWQSLTTLYIINDNIEKKLKFDNISLILFKLPSSYFIDKAILLKHEKKFSDLEKTYLDEIYFYLKNKYHYPKTSVDEINFNTLNLYLKVYSKDIKYWILNNLERDYVQRIN